MCTETSTSRRSQLWHGKSNTKWYDELLRRVKNEEEIQANIHTHTHTQCAKQKDTEEGKRERETLHFYSREWFSNQRYSKSTQINFKKMITFEALTAYKRLECDADGDGTVSG